MTAGTPVSPTGQSPMPRRMMGASQNYIASSTKKAPTKIEQGIVPAIQPMFTPTTARKDDKVESQNQMGSSRVKMTSIKTVVRQVESLRDKCIGMQRQLEM